ncbi:MAG: VanZ family protein [Nitrospiraceae bacterium]|nr:VanZ family protein [Nitrospiraceae bacterium]
MFAVMGFIYWMSTSVFTSAMTFALIRSVVDFFHPFTSGRELRRLNDAVRKSAHVFEYFILGLMLFRAFRGGGKKGLFRCAVFSVLAVAFYAFTDEFHQLFVPGRGGGEIMDVGIDTMGGVLAQIVSVLRLR